MSRNKENVPLNKSPRSNVSSLAPSRHIAGDEFFTDSLLDTTRLSSRIPSPNPQKLPLTKARRARTTRTARNAQPPLLRSSASESVVPRPRQKSWQPSTPLKSTADLSRIRKNSLTTPPDSKEDLPYPSPYSSISSPPPQDLTDAYQQIKDDEELAQTERELSSDDSGVSELEHAKPIRLAQRSQSESPLLLRPSLLRSPAASTPTRNLGDVSKRGRFIDRTETLSEASGLSFLKEMTNQDLAAALTPHISETARDKARWRAGWLDNSKPVAFRKAQVPSREVLRGESLRPTRVSAFSKASTRPPNIFSSDDQHLDYRNGSQSQQGNHNASQNGDDGHRNLPRLNNRVERNFNFSTNHGFPPPRSALTERNLEQQNRGDRNSRQALRSQSSAPSLLSDRSTNDARVLRPGTQMGNGHVSRLPQLRRSVADQKSMVDDPSQIDWAAAAADIPVPSVETSLNTEGNEISLVPVLATISPEKSRRWENDFTGQSFQVSESPPVRQRPAAQEQARDREIQGVAKQAVTTSRLSEIRERQSQESLRGMSRSPVPRSSSLQPELRPSAVEGDLEAIGEPIPDTPVVVYRSSSNSGGEHMSSTPSSGRQNTDGSRSHDHLQRLARAINGTPRSSPMPPIESMDKKEESNVPPTVEKIEQEPKSSNENQDEVHSETQSTSQATVAQTPKIVGGWTDTILPDTVKTAREAGRKTNYAQTPHVSAGGWVDTPAPVEHRQLLGSIPTIVEEVPEELTAGIVKNDAGGDAIQQQNPTNVEANVPAQDLAEAAEQPKSALASILDQQKNRLMTQDGTNATREDTLNLGNDTIESLQGLLGLDENDMTTLSRLSQLDDATNPLDQDQAKSEFLERLGIRIDRLRQKQTDTANGISEIERQVSYPVEQAVRVTTPQQLLRDTICTACNQQTFQPHFHPKATSQYFPYASLNLSLRIPLLFHPRTPKQWIPRPTFLGYITLAIWFWYLIENTMCELYCRPAYTDFYVWPTQTEPEYPFVIPIMIARWTHLDKLALGSFIFGIWSFTTGLARAVWRVIAMTVGWSDGFVTDGPSSRIVKKAIETATSIATAAVADATGLDLSMNDDEYI